ncbi:MAG: hypothetical protein WCD70_05775 [Alphaproteobacteria bacterium]
MRIIVSLLALILMISAAAAQSVSDNVPPFAADSAPEKAPAASAPPTATAPVDPYTVTDVNADVTADNASHARDQALMQAERSAYAQLCTRMGATDNEAKLDDATIESLVQSFEVQSEHLSSVRYIGVFTIQFKPQAVQKRIVKAATAAADAGETPPAPAVAPAKPMPTGPLSHMMIGVQADSLASWMQIKRRISTLSQVATIETLDLGRGISHIDLAYAGSIPDLQKALSDQGLVLRQAPTGAWEIYDGSMIER